MNLQDETRLRKMLLSLSGKPGITARRIVETEWNFLIYVAENYANPGPILATPKEAEVHWRKVSKASSQLVKALADLSKCDRAMFYVEWPNQDILPHPWNAPLVEIQKIEAIARWAENECKEQKEWGGAGPDVEHDKTNKEALFRRLFYVINPASTPKTHVHCIGAVIHAWATGEDESLDNPRFGERAMKHVTPRT